MTKKETLSQNKVEAENGVDANGQGECLNGNSQTGGTVIEIQEENEAIAEKELKTSGIPVVSFFEELFIKYDASFVRLLGFQYFNQGAKAMLYLAVKDYFKSYLLLEPSYMSQLQSFSGFPWSIKLVYGLLSDNVPIFGSKRRSYVIMMGFLQFASLLAVFLFELKDEKMITFLMFLASLSGAYLDVLVDALMVTQSRLDEKDGSEQLQTLSWGAMGAGGMFGSLLGAIVTEHYHPKWSFLAYSIFGLIVMILGGLLDKNVEIDEEEDCKKSKSLIEEAKLNLLNIKQAV